MSSSSPASKAIVRYATEQDVPTILTLIHELASFENASSAVHATPNSLLKTLSFPPTFPTGYARTLLLFDPTTTNTPAAMALYFHNYSTWRAAPGIYLEDLYVRPRFRGRGYGRRLLGELAREVGRVGGERLEWSVLRWNEGALGFYEGLGAERMEGWVGMRVEGVEKLEGLGGWGVGVEGVVGGEGVEGSAKEGGGEVGGGVVEG
ncbi:hypothetical protein MMC12_000435 [Toensbergia leucococca]|nr:hypothetical protein [Toensbergia leucococca]